MTLKKKSKKCWAADNYDKSNIISGVLKPEIIVDKYKQEVTSESKAPKHHKYKTPIGRN